MKKLLLTMLGVLMALPAMARDFYYLHEGQTITYTVIDEEAKTVSASKYDNISGDLILPSTPNDGDTDFTLVSIGEKAFYNCSSLTNVSIPNSVTSIGKLAFYNCSSLTSVSIPNSVTSIGVSAFSRCPLERVDVEDMAQYEMMRELGYTELEYYLNGEKIDPEGSSIEYEITGDNTCAVVSRDGGYSGNIVIPEEVTIDGTTYSVTAIGKEAFSNCADLTSVTIPNSVTTIGNMAFFKCSNLTSITIPASVTEIGEGAFNDCPLERVDVEDMEQYKMM